MSEEHDEVEVPRPREQEASFDEAMADQLKKSPFLIAFILFHGVLALAISAIILLSAEDSEPPLFEMVFYVKSANS